MRIATAASSIIKNSVPVRFLTWNLRYDAIPDSIPLSTTLDSLPITIPADDEVQFYQSPHEQPWSTRRVSVARDILFGAPAIICVQEALSRQVQDLATLLGDEYSWVGVGREDGKISGEFEAVFFQLGVVEIIEWDTIWLSETPFTPSKFPGAGSTRTATFVLMRLKDGGQAFTVVCTHWDEQSDLQRQLSASLLLRRGASAHKHGPVFILGDFNSPSSGADSSGYKIMTGQLPPVALPPSFMDRFPVSDEDVGFVFTDVAQATPPLGRSGHHATFTDFAVQEDMDLKRIDFVMAAGNSWKALRYRVGETWRDNSALASDHRPVWVDVKIGSAQ